MIDQQDPSDLAEAKLLIQAQREIVAECLDTIESLLVGQRTMHLPERIHIQGLVGGLESLRDRLRHITGPDNHIET